MSQPARTPLTEAQFSGVRSTVLDANPGMPLDMAGRIVEEGLKFVVTCARYPGIALAPSRVVDEGWHALLLHSAMYTELCGRFGNFVHHYPCYDPTRYDPAIIDRTQETIRKADYDPDPQLWGPPTDTLLVSVAAKCQHAPDCTIRPMPKPEWP